MFIDKKEADRRIKNSTGVLSRIRKTPSPSNGNGSHQSVPEQTTDSEPSEFDEKALKSLLNVKTGRGPTMSTPERASLAIASSLLGGRKAGVLMERGPDTALPMRHGYRSQDDMYGPDKKQDPELINELDIQKKTVRDLAFDRLTSALGLITHEKLEKVADVTKLSRVSRDLATVVDKTIPKEQAINNGVHFHIWKPDMKEESQYETINVNAPR